MFASSRMCVTVRLGEVGPRQVSRRDAALRFTLTSTSVTSGAIYCGRGHFQITNHRHEWFVTRNLTAQVNRTPAPLRRCQRTRFRRRLNRRNAKCSRDQNEYMQSHCDVTVLHLKIQPQRGTKSTKFILSLWCFFVAGNFLEITLVNVSSTATTRR